MGNLFGDRFRRQFTNEQELNNSRAYTDRRINWLKNLLTGITNGIQTALSFLTTRFNNHENARNNPHDVTAAQVGAPTTAAFNAHVGDDVRHFTDADRAVLRNATPLIMFNSLTGVVNSHLTNEVVHITAQEREMWSGMTPLPIFNAHVTNANEQITALWQAENVLENKVNANDGIVKKVISNEMNIANSFAGFAGGSGAHAINGGAIGNGAFSIRGGAVGEGAVTGDGFAGGSGAVTGTITSNPMTSDMIQLGTGTNLNPRTLQIYEFPLMNANGKIPIERLPDGVGSDKRFASLVIGNTAAGYTADSVDILWNNPNDVAEVQQVINDLSSRGGGQVILLDGNYSISGSTLEIPISVTLEGMGLNSPQIGGSSDGIISPLITLATNSAIKNINIGNIGNSATITIQGANCTVEGCTINTISSSMPGVQITGGNNAIAVKILNSNINALASIAIGAHVQGVFIIGNRCIGDVRLGSNSVNASHSNRIIGNSMTTMSIFGNNNVVVGNSVPGGVAIGSGTGNVVENNGG